jgi:hypothetical protein
MYRQGDVLIVLLDKMPTGFKPIAREGHSAIRAYGKETGHAHAIRDDRAVLLHDPKRAVVFLLVSGVDPVLLEHEEHDAIAIPPDQYRIVRQREYSPNAAPRSSRRTDRAERHAGFRAKQSAARSTWRQGNISR